MCDERVRVNGVEEVDKFKHMGVMSSANTEIGKEVNDWLLEEKKVT